MSDWGIQWFEHAFGKLVQHNFQSNVILLVVYEYNVNTPEDVEERKYTCGKIPQQQQRIQFPDSANIGIKLVM